MKKVARGDDEMRKGVKRGREWREKASEKRKGVKRGREELLESGNVSGCEVCHQISQAAVLPPTPTPLRGHTTRS